MANSDKNILITPNTGSSLNPTIAFTGSNASPITMSILDTGALSFSGTSGQLFSIVDSLSGSIFSVNDISGIPSLEILDTGLVKLNQYGGNTAIGVATPYTGLISSGAARLSISTISAATAGLIVKGKPSQSENLVEFYRSSADANAVFKIQAGLYSVYIDNLAVGNNVYSNYQIVGGASVGNMGNYLHQFNSWNAAWVTVGVRGAASQTANLQEWQNSAGTAVAVVGNTGTIRSSIFANLTPSLTYIATNYDNSGVGIVITNSAYKGLVIRGVASQSANLQEWQNSSGFGVLTVSANGNIVLGNSNVADNNYIDFIKAGGGGTGGLSGIRFGSPTTQQTLTIDTGNAHLLLAHQNAASSFIVKGFTSQSANLQEWQNSAGSVRLAVSSYGTLFSYTEAVFSNLLNGAGTALLVKTNNAGGKPLIAQGAASQTANLQEWQNSAGTVLSKINSDGSFQTGGGAWTKIDTTYGQVAIRTDGSLLGSLSVGTGSPSLVGIVVRGAASQTADLQQWQNSSGTVLAQVDKDGNVNTTKSFVQSGTIGTTYAIDGSGNEATYAANATVNFPNFSGMILIDCQNDGTLSLWLCGGGSAPIRIGGSRTTGANDGTMAANSGISGYTWTNANVSQTVNITAIRTRAGA